MKRQNGPLRASLWNGSKPCGISESTHLPTGSIAAKIAGNDSAPSCLVKWLGAGRLVISPASLPRINSDCSLFCDLRSIVEPEEQRGLGYRLGSRHKLALLSLAQRREFLRKLHVLFELLNIVTANDNRTQGP
jgi:hypothetical protein